MIMKFLVTDHGMIPLDRLMNLETTRRLRNSPFFSDFQLNAAAKLKIRLGLKLGMSADLRKRFAENAGASVENRNFGSVDFDAKVIDAENLKRRHQMLDRADLNLAVTQGRCQLGVHDVLIVSADSRAPPEDPCDRI